MPFPAKLINNQIRLFIYQIIIIHVCVFTWIMVEVLSYYLTKYIIDNHYWSNNFLVIPITIIFMFLCYEIALRFCQYILHNYIPRVIEILQTNILTNILQQPLLTIKQYTSQIWSHRIIIIGKALEQILNIWTFAILPSLLLFCFTIYFLKNLPFLLIVYVIWFFALLIISLKSNTAIKDKACAFEKSESETNNLIVNILQNILTIITCNKNDYESQILTKQLHKHKIIYLKLNQAIFFTDSARAGISYLLLISIYIFIFNLFFKGKIEAGTVSFICSTSLVIRSSLWRAAASFTDFSKNISIIKSALEIMPVHTYHAPTKLNLKISSIEIQNVTLTINNETIISNLDLKMKLGEKIAIIGPTGSGKTSLAKILCGAIAPTNGEFVINKQQKISEIARLNHNFVFLEQEPNLFNRSLEENIIYQGNDFNQQQFNEALEIALCLDFYNKFKKQDYINGLEFNLSAGQKQRIAIARAIYSNKPWLIFDEPTASLDIDTEKKLIDNLLNFSKNNKTLIIITHSPLLIKKMERIIILKDGKIVDQGSFDVLLNRNKFFQSIFNYN